MEDINLDSEKLLESSSSSSNDDNKDVDDYLQDRRNDSRKVRRYRIIGVALLVLLGLTNFGWYWKYPQISWRQEAAYMSYFSAGEPDKILINFDHDWTGLTEKEVVGKYRYRDEKWKDLFPYDGGSVALSKDFVKSLGLYHGAAETRENSSEVHYMVAGYHQLHCLSVVRDTIYQLNGTSTITDPILWDHVLHCVEAVRQALYCFLDPTLIPLARAWPGIPNGQPHVCRNRDAMFRWSEEHQHDLPGEFGPEMEQKSEHDHGHDHSHSHGS